MAVPDRLQRVDHPVAQAVGEPRGVGTGRGPDVEHSAQVRARLDELLSDMRELPERQRGALAMRELGGLEYAEIGAALETSPAGAKQAIYEARRALHEMAKGRDMDCDFVRSAVSDGDGRALRGRAVRAHMRACADCESFRTSITERRTALGALSPALPAAASARLFENVMAAAGGGSVAGAGLYTGVGVPVALKSVTAVAMAVTVGVGVIEVAQIGHPGSARHHHAGAAPANLPSSAANFAIPSHVRDQQHGRHGHAGPAGPGAHRASAAARAHAKAGGGHGDHAGGESPPDTAERPIASDSIDAPPPGSVVGGHAAPAFRADPPGGAPGTRQRPGGADGGDGAPQHVRRRPPRDRHASAGSPAPREGPVAEAPRALASKIEHVPATSRGSARDAAGVSLRCGTPSRPPIRLAHSRTGKRNAAARSNG